MPRMQTKMAASGFSLTKQSYTVDLGKIPTLTFSDVEEYAKKTSSCDGKQKAYKYFAEPGYLHDIKVKYTDQEAFIMASCHRSMKKNDPPHSLHASKSFSSRNISGKCTCVAGLGGFCQHVIGLLFLIAHYKQLGFKSVPDELTSTMMAQRWSIPRGKSIEPQCVNNVLVKKPKDGADYNKYIKSTLYCPSSHYLLLCGLDQIKTLEDLDPQPLITSLLPKTVPASELPAVATKFGWSPKGSVLSYQQKLSSRYVINDYSNPEYPDLPVNSTAPRFSNNLSICLNYEKLAKFESIALTTDMSKIIESKTRDQDESSLWHHLRLTRITASKFGSVARRVANFESLVKQLQPSRNVQTAAMKRGKELEATAAGIYAQKVKNNRVNLFPCGLVIHPYCPWLGCSPDRKVFDIEDTENARNPYGLLEVKVVNEGAVDFKNVSYLKHDPNTNQLVLNENHIYYYQVQCQLGLTRLEWCDFFSYIDDDKYFCQRINYKPIFFQGSKDKVDIFYFNYFL